MCVCVCVCVCVCGCVNVCFFFLVYEQRNRNSDGINVEICRRILGAFGGVSGNLQKSNVAISFYMI